MASTVPGSPHHFLPRPDDADRTRCRCVSTGCQASERQGKRGQSCRLADQRGGWSGPRSVWTYTVRHVVRPIDRRPQRWLRQLRASRRPLPPAGRRHTVIPRNATPREPGPRISLQRSPRRPARHRHTPGHTAAATAAPPVPRPHPTDRRYSALTATPPRRAAVSACASWAAARDPSLTHHRRNPAPPRLPHCGRSPRRGGRVRGARRALRSDCGATVLCGAWGPRSAPPLTRPARKDDDRPREPDSLTARKACGVDRRLDQHQQRHDPSHR